MWSYSIIHKTGEETLSCLKKFEFSFGNHSKLHTDNGLEFKNNKIIEFCLSYKIEHVFSKPYSPK